MPLMTAGLPLMKSALRPLCKSALLPLSYSKENLCIWHENINHFK